ncbi:MAG TPA: hypothetical protein VFV87_07750 [Pirellulaceae bacterium]|nr:hypothetical protein [Pirellulaceae bacterium]
MAAATLPLRSSIAAEEAADTSARARSEATRLLPLDELTAETRRKLMAVVERPTIFRRLPHKSFDCDPELYLFLIRNPEVVVSIWDVMGISNMAAQRLGPYQWKGSDGSGTECDIELVYGTDELHVLYGDGHYSGPLLKRKITGRSVLILSSGYGQAADRRWQVGNRLDVFLQLDDAGADLVARTISPWVGKVADSNFAESCKFASRLSLTAEQNADGMQRLSEKLTKVEPPVRQELARISAAIGQRAETRVLAAGVPERRG